MGWRHGYRHIDRHGIRRIHVGIQAPHPNQILIMGRPPSLLNPGCLTNITGVPPSRLIFGTSLEHFRICGIRAISGCPAPIPPAISRSERIQRRALAESAAAGMEKMMALGSNAYSMAWHTRPHTKRRFPVPCTRPSSYSSLSLLPPSSNFRPGRRGVGRLLLCVTISPGLHPHH